MSNMSDHSSEGAAYLAALKHPASSSAALAPERGPSGFPDTQGRTGAEKRRSPRYRCHGGAQLRELETAVSTWAKFTDISLHGCYVEATATYPIGTALALTIDVSGFRIETRGEVRVTYPNLGMGIFFTTMSDGDRERLRELLRSLSGPSVILGVAHTSQTASALPPEPLPPITNPQAALQAMVTFFANRQILSRDEFLRILRRSQSAEK
jgi:hypothetical protein